MKIIKFIFILLIISFLAACDGIVSIATTLQESTEHATTMLPTEETSDQETIIETQVPTEMPTTQDISTNEITTIISDNIYIVLHAGQDTVEINSEWNDAGASIYINDSENVMNTTDTVDIETLGLYKLTYNYQNGSSIYEIERYVMVVDQTPPELELNLGIDTVKVNTEWIDAGVSVSDNSLESITYIVEGEVDTIVSGVYKLTYIAEDSSGNISEIYRFITVIE